MKKLLLSIVALVFLNSTLFAQNPPISIFDGNFNTNTALLPSTGWGSLISDYVVPGFPPMYSITPNQSASGFSGTQSVKITSTKLVTSPSTLINDTSGLLWTGSFAIGAGGLPSFRFKLPYSSKPQGLACWLRYQPNGNDTALILVFTTRKNNATGTIDTVASKSYKITGNIPEYQKQLINLDYKVNQSTSPNPDSVAIYISSTSLKKPKIGSVLYLDAFDFYANGESSLQENANNYFEVFYTQQNKNLNVKVLNLSRNTQITIFDINGKAVIQKSIVNETSVVNTQTLSPAMYFYQIANDEGVLNTGKFVVN
jgi:hypothetical protein